MANYAITPRDTHLMKLMLAQELGRGMYNKDGNFNQRAIDQVLSTLVNRQRLAQMNPNLGSPYFSKFGGPTISELLLQPKQFTGMNTIANEGGFDPAIKDRLLKIVSGKGEPVSDEEFFRLVNLNKKGRQFLNENDARLNEAVTNFFNPIIADSSYRPEGFEDIYGYLNIAAQNANQFENMVTNKDSYDYILNHMNDPGFFNRPPEEQKAIMDAANVYVFDVDGVPQYHTSIGNKIFKGGRAAAPGSVTEAVYRANPDLYDRVKGVGYMHKNIPHLQYSLTGARGDITERIPLNSNTPQDPYNEIGIENFNIDSSPSFDFFKPLNTKTVAPMYGSPNNQQQISMTPVAPLNIIGEPPRDIRIPNQDDGGIDQRMADEIFRGSPRALFNDGTPNVGNYGASWSPTHNDMLTNAIEGLRNRFPEASNDEILTSLKNSNIVQDIQGQVNHMAMNPGSQLMNPPGSERLDVPSLENNTDTVPAMLTPGEAVIPAEAAQLPKNQKVIKEFIQEGRELQDKKEELGIPPENQNFNEDLSKDINKALSKVNEENFRAKEEARLQGTLPEVNKPKSKYDVGFLDRLSEFGKNVFYPFGPGGLSNQNLNKTSSEKENITPQQPNFNLNIPDRDVLPGTVPPPMQGPAKPEAIPQQYINDASDYTPEQKENQNKIVESLPPDVELEQKLIDIDREELERIVTEAKGYTDANAPKFKEVTNWIEENLGFNKQDLYRTILYYVGGRLSGGSHGGSLRWAARQVIQESSARAKTQAAAAASNTLSKSQQLNYYKDLAKMFLKNPGLTPSAIRKLEKALAAGDIQSMADVINNTGNKFRTEIGMKANTTKPEEVYLKDGYENNTFIVYPSTDGSGLKYYIDPETKKVVGINQNKVRPFTASIEDNIPALVARHYEGNDKAKLKTIFDIQGGGSLATKLRNYAKEKNIPSQKLTNPMLSLLGGMSIPEGYDPQNPGSFKPEKGYKSLEAALDMVILSGGKQADLTKLENVNQANVNKMVEDFGGANEATKVLQAVDATLNAEPISPERVEAGIKNLTDKEKAVVAKQPNDYFKLLYMAYFSRKVKE